jgi:hypothetical protein
VESHKYWAGIEQEVTLLTGALHVRILITYSTPIRLKTVVIHAYVTYMLIQVRIVYIDF